MLSYQLQSAIKDLETLIALSLEDIDDIKEAKHNPQFDRLAIKEEKIKSFEQKKREKKHVKNVKKRDFQKSGKT